MRTAVSVVDYGVGNLLSVSRALEQCGADVRFATTADDIRAAERVVLPGVGAFGDAMDELRNRGLIEAIRDHANTGKPFLGICLGMQMMLDSSEEFGLSEGLGLVPGTVVPVPAQGTDGQPHKIPHIGWNEIRPTGTGGAWQETMLTLTEPEAPVYFVHSYMAVPQDSDFRLADCEYDGVAVPAVIRRGNLYGCQFHPEKSGAAGLGILRGFLSLT